MNKLGMDYLGKNQLESAYELLKKVEELVVQSHSIKNNFCRIKLLAITLNNIGCYYKKRKKGRMALYYLRKSLELERNTGVRNANSRSGTLLNICAIYSDLNQQVICEQFTPRHREAQQCAQAALRLLLRAMEQENGESTNIELGYAESNVASNTDIINENPDINPLFYKPSEPEPPKFPSKMVRPATSTSTSTNTGVAYNPHRSTKFKRTSEVIRHLRTKGLINSSGEKKEGCRSISPTDSGSNSKQKPFVGGVHDQEAEMAECQRKNSILSTVAIAYHNYAVESEYLWEKRKSLDAYKHGLQISKNILGEKHPLTQTILNSYGNANKKFSSIGKGDGERKEIKERKERKEGCSMGGSRCVSTSTATGRGIVDEHLGIGNIAEATFGEQLDIGEYTRISSETHTGPTQRNWSSIDHEHNKHNEHQHLTRNLTPTGMNTHPNIYPRAEANSNTHNLRSSTAVPSYRIRINTNTNTKTPHIPLPVFNTSGIQILNLESTSYTPYIPKNSSTNNTSHDSHKMTPTLSRETDLRLIKGNKSYSYDRNKDSSFSPKILPDKEGNAYFHQNHIKANKFNYFYNMLDKSIKRKPEIRDTAQRINTKFYIKNNSMELQRGNKKEKGLINYKPQNENELNPNDIFYIKKMSTVKPMDRRQNIPKNTSLTPVNQQNNTRSNRPQGRYSNISKNRVIGSVSPEGRKQTQYTNFIRKFPQKKKNENYKPTKDHHRYRKNETYNAEIMRKCVIKESDNLDKRTIRHSVDTRHNPRNIINQRPKKNIHI